MSMGDYLQGRCEAETTFWVTDWGQPTGVFALSHAGWEVKQLGISFFVLFCFFHLGDLTEKSLLCHLYLEIGRSRLGWYTHMATIGCSLCQLFSFRHVCPSLPQTSLPPITSSSPSSLLLPVFSVWVGNSWRCSTSCIVLVAKLCLAYLKTKKTLAERDKIHSTLITPT